MGSRTLSAQSLWDILTGATLLGSGGGGPYTLGRTFVEDILNAGQTVELVTVDAIDDGTFAAVVAGVGAPTASEDFDVGAPVAALLRLEKALKHEIPLILPGEVGPGNTLLPMSTAAQLKRPILDAAGASRAMPTLPLATFAEAGIPASPAVLADRDNQVVVGVKTVEDAEKVIRGIIGGGVFPDVAGVAFWSMTGADVKRAAVRGTTTLAEDVGRAIRTAKDKVGAAAAAINGRVIFTGTLVEQVQAASGGFDMGYLKLRDKKGAEAYIYNQNENLVAWACTTAHPLVIGPDLICFITTDGQPFSNADLDMDTVKGKEIAVIGAPAPASQRTRYFTDQYLALLRPLGYGGPFVPFE